MKHNVTPSLCLGGEEGVKGCIDQNTYKCVLKCEDLLRFVTNLNSNIKNILFNVTINF